MAQPVSQPAVCSNGLTLWLSQVTLHLVLIIPVCDKLVITLNYLVEAIFYRYQQCYRRPVNFTAVSVWTRFGGDQPLSHR